MEETQSMLSVSQLALETLVAMAHSAVRLAVTDNPESLPVIHEAIDRDANRLAGVIAADKDNAQRQYENRYIELHKQIDDLRNELGIYKDLYKSALEDIERMSA